MKILRLWQKPVEAQSDCNARDLGLTYSVAIACLTPCDPGAQTGKNANAYLNPEVITTSQSEAASAYVQIGKHCAAPFLFCFFPVFAAVVGTISTACFAELFTLVGDCECCL